MKQNHESYTVGYEKVVLVLFLFYASS